MAVIPDPPLERPLPLKIRYERGVEVSFQKRRHVIVAPIDLSLFLIEDPESGERLQAELRDLSLWTGSDQVARRKIPDLESIPLEKREIGLKRQKVIDDLLSIQHRTKQMVVDFGAELGLEAAQLYKLMRRYQREGTWTCLIPHGEKGQPPAKRLHKDVETIIDAVIEEDYFTRHRVPVTELVTVICGRCRAAGLPEPSYNTVKNRVLAKDARRVTEGRYGKKVAREKHDPVLGAHNEARWPHQRYQIDHTVADLFVVDEENFLPVARPILTLVIDEFSRCVVGFYLSLRAPSTMSVALALHHAFMPKDEYCRRMELESPWPACGFPDELFSDNATEFDSRGLQLGCNQYGIHGEFRPLGRANFGGRIERLVGTVMGRVRLMPGATMNSIEQRGHGYDPEAHSALTLAEAEKRIASEIADQYHRQIHEGLGTTPLKAYRFGVLGDDKTPGRGLPAMPTDPQRLLLDFLPADYRSIQDYGVQYERTRYYGSILRVMRDRDRRASHLIRHDPRDMSLWIYSKDDAEYFQLPRARSHMPPMALWEVKTAIRHLKAEGRDPDDEEAVYRAVMRARKADEAAKLRTKTARRNIERRRAEAAELARVAPSVSSPPPKPVAAAPSASSSSAPNERKKIKPIQDVEPW